MDWEHTLCQRPPISIFSLSLSVPISILFAFGCYTLRHYTWRVGVHWKMHNHTGARHNEGSAGRGSFSKEAGYKWKPHRHTPSTEISTAENSCQKGGE